jgi:two-component system, cell cycle response regulator CtrA
MRVLLLQDSEKTKRNVAHLLRQAATIVDLVESVEDAEEFLQVYDYDIFLLNLDTPHQLEWLKKSRHGRRVPLLALSDITAPQVKARLLNLGVDNFLVGTEPDLEIIAHIQAIVRRSKGLSHSTIHVGPIEVKIDERKVFVSGTQVRLSPKEYAIVEVLALRKGQMVTKENILSHLYDGSDDPVETVVDVFISRIRKKLSNAGANKAISTVWGSGYTLRDSAAADQSATVPPDNMLRDGKEKGHSAGHSLLTL